MPTPGFGGPVAPVRQQFTDAEGRPLAGGRVYHYLPDTSTPTDTWADPDFSVLNTNPVVLDAAGRAVIYCDKLVRQVLYDRYGTLIWDGETVTNLGVNSSGAINLTNISALRANTTNYPLFYLLGYYTPNDGQGGSFWLDTADTTSSDDGGAVIVDAAGHRYKRLDNEGPIDVRKFGAKGDGVTVDTTSFTNAIAYGQASKKAVLQSQGTYITTTSPNDVSSYPLSLASIAALRANVTPYPFFRTLGYYSAGDGGGGSFRWDVTDTSTADNGGTVIVDADGRRYKRLDVLSYVDVKWFGAVGDNSTDNLPMLQAAAATGLTLFFSPGQFKTTGQTTISAKGQWVTGSGQASEIWGYGNFDTFYFTGSVQDQRISDITFRSANKTGGYDFHAHQSFKFGVYRVTSFSTWSCWRMGHGNASRCEDLWIGAFRGPRGILFEAASQAVTTGGLQYKNIIAAPDLNGSGGVAWECNGDVPTISGTGFHCVGGSAGTSKLTFGLWLHNTIGAATPPIFFFMHDTEIEFALGSSIRLDACIDFNLVGSYTNIAYLGSAIHIGAGCRDTVIDTSYVGAAAQHGIFNEGSNTVISDCIITNNSYPHGGSYPNNTGLYDGIYCGPASEDTQISGCIISNAAGAGQLQRYGVYGAAGARRISVTGCNLVNNFQGGFRDDTGVGVGNFKASGNAGVTSSFESNLFIGATAGYRGLVSPTIVAGVITAVTIDDPGFHYSSPPSIFAFDPAGTGSGCTFTVTVANGKITSVIPSGGGGYSNLTFLYIRPANDFPGLRVVNPLAVNNILDLSAQGNAAVQLGNEYGVGLKVAAALNTVNQLQTEGSAAGTSPNLRAVGADADIDVVLIPKGSGNIRFGTYSAGAPVATGYITMKTQGGGTILIPCRLV